MARNKITIGTTTEELNDARLPASLGTTGQVLAVNSAGTGIEWATIQSGADNYESVKVSSIANMGALRQLIDNINQQGKHCFFDFSDYISGAYVCTVQMYSVNSTNYCYIFDLLNHKIYGSLTGYADATTIASYATASANNNDLPYILKITDNTTTLADIIADIDRVNALGHHVFVDVSALNSSDYLVTITYSVVGTKTNLQVVGLVKGVIASGSYDTSNLATTTLVSLLNTSHGILSASMEIALDNSYSSYKKTYGGYKLSDWYFYITAGGNVNLADTKSGNLTTAVLPTNSGSAYTWNSIACDGNIAMACSTSNYVAYTYDGFNWIKKEVMTDGGSSYNKIFKGQDNYFYVYNNTCLYSIKLSTLEISSNYTSSNAKNSPLVMYAPNITQYGVAIALKPNANTIYPIVGGAGYSIPEALNWTSMTQCHDYIILTASGSNRLYYTKDLVNWNYATLPSSSSWASACAIPGGYAVSDSSNHNLYYTTDLINWNTITSSHSYLSGELVYDHNLLSMNSGNDYSGYVELFKINNSVYYNGDNINKYLADTFDSYIPRQIPSHGVQGQVLTKTEHHYDWKNVPENLLLLNRYPQSDEWIKFSNSVAFYDSSATIETDGEIVIVGLIDKQAHYLLFKSTDYGATWSQISDNTCYFSGGLKYTNGKWMALHNTSPVVGYISTDTTTWTTITPPITSGTTSLDSAHELFFQSQNTSGTITMYCSSDGNTWTQCVKSTETTYQFGGSNIVYANGYYWQKARTSNGSENITKIFKSSNGITWDLIDIGVSTSSGISYVALALTNGIAMVGQRQILYTEDFTTWKLSSGNPVGYMTSGIYANNDSVNYGYINSVVGAPAINIYTFDSLADISKWRIYSSARTLTSIAYNSLVAETSKPVHGYELILQQFYDTSLNSSNIALTRIKVNNAITQKDADVTNKIADFMPDQHFMATYGITTFNEITSALNAGKVCYVEKTEEGYTYIFQLTRRKATKYYFTAFYDEVYTGQIVVDTDNEWELDSTEVENSDNKVVSISSSSTDTQYPSAKAVRDDVYTPLNTAIGALNEDKADRADVHPLINIWDEQWGNGYWDNTGKHIASNNVCSVNLIDVKPNTKYYCHIPNYVITLTYYTSNGVYISFDDLSASSEFTTPSTAYKVGLHMVTGYGTTYNSDISINYPSTYHGYYPSALPKEIAERKDEDFMITMDGFISPTINGIKNYWDGSLYHRRIARVDLGSLGWSQHSTQYHPYGAYYATCPSVKDNTENAYILGFKYGDINNDKEFIIGGSHTIQIGYHNTTASALKTLLSGKFLYYELATEQTCNIDANGLRFELLWENASPSASFGTQTVSLDLSKYKFVAIMVRKSSDSDQRRIEFMHTNLCNSIYNLHSGDEIIRFRQAMIASNGISFGGAYIANSYGNASLDYGTTIPIQIYGIR